MHPAAGQEEIQRRKRSMHIFPLRVSLQEELGGEILKLVSYSATPEQWAEWLRIPLEHAAARGNLGLVDALLEAGADGSAGWRGCRGRTLLDAAAVGGNPEVVTALLQAGAEPDVNVVSMSPKRSALYVAVVCGHEEAARRLVKAGADVRFEDPVTKGTVLHEAAYDGHELLVNDLLIAGADPNSDFSPGGCTPLQQAAYSGQVGNLSALLLWGANKDALDGDGNTSLIWAAQEGRLAAVETLLAAGADVKTRNNYGDSALDVAACKGHIPVLEVILGHGTDVNSFGYDGCSALHKAVGKSQADAIDVLLDAGADIDFKSNSGRTPLYHAAYFSLYKPMLALLKRGAFVSAHAELALTPLHGVCLGRQRGLEAAVDLLLRWGADETALDDHRRTPADFLNLPQNTSGACLQGELEHARLLLARAPADRAWRRRCWLVMLQSRAAKGRASSYDSGEDGSDASSYDSGFGGQGSEVGMVAAREGSGSSEGSARSQGSNSRGRGGVGEESESGNLSGLVERLLWLELDGVFRTTVGFL